MIEDNTPSIAEYAKMKEEEAVRKVYSELVPIIRYLLVAAGGEVTISQEIQDLYKQDVEMTNNIVDGSITLKLMGE